MPLTKVTKSLITSVDVSQINTVAGDAGKVLTSNGSTLSWTASASIAPSSATTAKAWVNFNGTTSPGTIRSSYNVSSVTKNGTGNYTVNFTNAMADANYSVYASADTVTGAGNATPAGFLSILRATPPTTSSVSVQSVVKDYSAVIDVQHCSVGVFGN